MLLSKNTTSEIVTYGEGANNVRNAIPEIVLRKHAQRKLFAQNSSAMSASGCAALIEGFMMIINKKQASLIPVVVKACLFLVLAFLIRFSPYFHMMMCIGAFIQDRMILNIKAALNRPESISLNSDLQKRI